MTAAISKIQANSTESCSGPKTVNPQTLIRRVEIWLVTISCLLLVWSGIEKLFIAYAKLFTTAGFEYLLGVLLLALGLSLFSYRRHKGVLLAISGIYLGFTLTHVANRMGWLSRPCDCFPVSGFNETALMTATTIIASAAMALVIVHAVTTNRIRGLLLPPLLAGVVYVAAVTSAVADSTQRHAERSEAKSLVATEKSRVPIRDQSATPHGFTKCFVEVCLLSNEDRPMHLNVVPTCRCQEISTRTIDLPAKGKATLTVHHLVKTDYLDSEKRSLMDLEFMLVDGTTAQVLVPVRRGESIQ